MCVNVVLVIIHPLFKKKEREKITPTKWARAKVETQNPQKLCGKHSHTLQENDGLGRGWQEDPASVF